VAGTGPPPKDPEKRARRNATVATVALPAAGRKGRTPAWPLPADVRRVTMLKVLRAKAKDLQLLADAPDLTARQRQKLDQDLAQTITAAATLDAELKEARKYERTLWVSLWKTPMAVQWERLSWNREVALYVRWQVRAELGDLKASSEARLRAEALGLTPMSLLRLRWRVEDKPAEDKPGSAPRSGARARYSHLRAVDATGA
jgi:hypothetical protein